MNIVGVIICLLFFMDYNRFKIFLIYIIKMVSKYNLVGGEQQYKNKDVIDLFNKLRVTGLTSPDIDQDTLNKVNALSANESGYITEDQFKDLYGKIRQQPYNYTFAQETAIITADQATNIIHNPSPANIMATMPLNKADPFVDIGANGIPNLYNFYNEFSPSEEDEYDTLRFTDAQYRMFIFSLEYYVDNNQINIGSLFVPNTGKNIMTTEWASLFNTNECYNAVFDTILPPTDVLKIIFNEKFKQIYFNDFRKNTFKIQVADAGHDWIQLINDNHIINNRDYMTIFNEIRGKIGTSTGSVNQHKCQNVVKEYGVSNINLINKFIRVDQSGSSVLIPGESASAKYVGVLKENYSNIINPNILNAIGIDSLNIESDNTGLLKSTIKTFHKYTLNAGKIMDAAPLGIGKEFVTTQTKNYKLPIIVNLNKSIMNYESYQNAFVSLSPKMSPVETTVYNIDDDTFNYIINNIFLGGLLNGKLKVETEMSGRGIISADPVTFTTVVNLTLNKVILQIKCDHKQKLSLNGLSNMIGYGNVRGASVSNESEGAIQYILFDLAGKQLANTSLLSVIDKADKLNIMFLKTLTDSIQIYYMLMFKHNFPIPAAKSAMIIYDLTCADYAMSLGIPVIKTRSNNIDIFVPDIYQSQMSLEIFKQRIKTLSFFTNHNFQTVMLSCVETLYNTLRDKLHYIIANTPGEVYYYASMFCINMLDSVKAIGIANITEVKTKLEASKYTPTVELINIMDDSLGQTFRKLASADQLLDKFEEVYSKLNKLNSALESAVSGGTNRGRTIAPIYFDIKQVFINIELPTEAIDYHCALYLANALIMYRSRNSSSDIESAIQESLKITSADNLVGSDVLEKVLEIYVKITNGIQNNDDAKLAYIYHIPYSIKLGNIDDITARMNIVMTSPEHVLSGGGKKHRKIKHKCYTSYKNNLKFKKYHTTVKNKNKKVNRNYVKNKKTVNKKRKNKRVKKTLKKKN